jgi:hypothetical protein
LNHDIVTTVLLHGWAQLTRTLLVQLAAVTFLESTLPLRKLFNLIGASIQVFPRNNTQLGARDTMQHQRNSIAAAVLVATASVWCCVLLNASAVASQPGGRVGDDSLAKSAGAGTSNDNNNKNNGINNDNDGITTGSSGGHSVEQHPGASVVLVGGDVDNGLPRPALLRAAFNLHMRAKRNRGPAIQVWVAAGVSVDHGTQLLAEALTHDGAVGCPDDEPVGGPGVERCTDADATAFRKTVRYTQLSDDQGYAALCARLNESALAGGELGRVFFLSRRVPGGLIAAAQSVARHCAPVAKGAGWLRVAIEPPVEYDLANATALATELSRAGLDEGRVHIVERVLATPGARQITSFRAANTELDQILCSDFVDKVEIVLSESTGVGAGGFRAYDAAEGAVRAALRGPLTQLLATLGADLDHATSSADLQHEKEHFLESVQPVDPASSTAGQYSGYLDECHMADHTTSSSVGVEASARTATMAIATLRARDERWLGVPFHVFAGKRLRSTHTYIRVQFRDLPVLGGARSGMVADERPESGQMVFHIEGGEPERPPAVYVMPLR